MVSRPALRRRSRRRSPQPIAVADIDGDATRRHRRRCTTRCRSVSARRASAGSAKPRPGVFAAEADVPDRRHFGRELRRQGAGGRRSRRRRAARRARGDELRHGDPDPELRGAAGARQGVGRRRAAALERNERRARVSCRRSRSVVTRPTSTVRPCELRDATGHHGRGDGRLQRRHPVITITPTAPLPNGRYSVHLSGLHRHRRRDAGRRGHDVLGRSRARRDRAADDAGLAAVGSAVDRERHADVHDERGRLGVLVQLRQRAVPHVHVAAARDRQGRRAFVPRVRT